MSQFNEPLKIEVIGEAIIVEPYFPKTRDEKKAGTKGIITVSDLKDKNPHFPEKKPQVTVQDFDEHPAQGIVKAISPTLQENDEKLGSIKINDRIGFRIGAGEPIVYKDVVYWRLAPHEVIFKYLGSER